MKPEKVFEGFEHNPYEAEARERWGDEQVDANNERMPAPLRGNQPVLDPD
jgi:hypothetical protein